MKKLVKKIILAPIYLWSYLVSPKTSEWLRLRAAVFYGAWLKRSFAVSGDIIIVYSPMYLHGGEFMSLGDNFCCDTRLRLDAFGDKGDSLKLIIGNNFNAQKDCHIGAANKITIGHNVLLASKVYISDHSHGEITSDALELPPTKRPIHSKGEIHIGNNVWIGEGAMILPGVTIGDNAIIGAGSIVTKSVPANSVAAGNPARIIKTL